MKKKKTGLWKGLATPLYMRNKYGSKNRSANQGQENG